MANPSPTVERGGAKAERTRATILAAAEELFAKQGFAPTRLEDVADAVKVTRAALFYYYRDKQALFDAVLQDAFGKLATRLEQVLAAKHGTAAERIEQAVIAWVDSIVERPSLARLILRIVADGPEQLAHGVFVDNNQLPAKFWMLFQEGRRTGELKPLHEDPFHAASAIIGTTVFYVTALSALVPHGRFEPLDPQQVAAHKSEALHATRRLLGIAERVDLKAVKH